MVCDLTSDSLREVLEQTSGAAPIYTLIIFDTFRALEDFKSAITKYLYGVTISGVCRHSNEILINNSKLFLKTVNIANIKATTRGQRYNNVLFESRISSIVKNEIARLLNVYYADDVCEIEDSLDHFLSEYI